MKERVLTADLHLHSDHSGLKHLRFLRMRDCYSPPVAVYQRAKARGMDLVTLTDHDTIDGCLEVRDVLGDPDDFFMSEEVETFLPGDRSMHIGVFGITERQHHEIQRSRRDFESLVAYLAEQEIPFALNHLFRGYRPGQNVEAYLTSLVSRFSLFETRNGTQSARYRALTERCIARFQTEKTSLRAGETGGSDAHTMARVGRTWTECRGSDRESFLSNLRAGRSRARGEDGRLLPLSRDVYSVVLSYYGTLLGQGRVKFARGERWPGALFSFVTLPSHVIAFPLLATGWNLLLKRLGIGSIEAEIAKLVAPASRPEPIAEAELCAETEP